MRILAASDIHGDSKSVKRLADKAEKGKVDLVVLCGDLTGWAETKNIIKPFTTCKSWNLKHCNLRQTPQFAYPAIARAATP